MTVTTSNTLIGNDPALYPDLLTGCLIVWGILITAFVLAAIRDIFKNKGRR